jgi:predicted aldo/keto reductase-like oxidoreductase
LDSQLERLRTNHIDYCLVHSLVVTLLDKLEKIDILGLLDRARADGRIVNTGFLYTAQLRTLRNSGRIPLGHLPHPVQLPG